jgi:hypothetical protein
MKKHRTTLAIAFVALLAAAGGDANAGKGKIRRAGGGGSLERTSNGVVFREKATHTKGIRSKLTFGKLGRTLSVTNEQSSEGVKSTVQRGRKRVTKAVAGSANGTLSNSTYEKKNFFTRKWKAKVKRSDTVGDNEVTEQSARKKTFGGWEMQAPRRTGRMGNTEEFINGQPQAVSPTRKPFKGKLKGRRAISRTPDSMQIADTQTKRWGLLKTVSFGLIGRKKQVAVEQRQTADGLDVAMTTPRRGKVTRQTTVGDGVTRSTGEFTDKRGRVRERDEVTVTRDGGVHRTEKLRRDGSVKRIITERMTNDGRTRVTTKKVRKDGSVSKIKEKESVIGRDGKKSRQRSRTTFRKNGSVRTNIGIGKVDGDRQFNVKTPIGSIGTVKDRITTNGPGPAHTRPDRE